MQKLSKILKISYKLFLRHLYRQNKNSDRFSGVDKYRKSRQILSLAFVTGILGFTQNCSNKFSVAEYPSIGSSVPVIVVLTDVLPVSNSRNQNIVFTVDTLGSTFQSASCQLNQSTAFDCTSMIINLTNLADGDYQLKIDAKDSLDVSAQTVNITFRIDATAPTISYLQTPPATTGSTAATITFVANDSLSGVARIECSLDSAVFATCVSPVSLTNLSSGNHSFRVRSIDQATNVSVIASSQWTVNTSAPILNITAQPSSISNSKNASFSFSGTSAGQPLTIFECRLDAGGYTACNSGTQSYSNLAEGTRSFSVRGRTSSGTMSDPVTVSWVVDSVAPAAPVITANVIAETRLKNASFTFVATDVTSGVASYQCSIDGGSYGTCTSPSAHTNLADGARVFRVQATDQAGNTSAVSAFNWTIDTVVPVLAFTSAPISSANTAATFAFNHSDAGVGIQSVQCSLNNATYANCTSPHNVTVANGSHTFRVQATDRAGNSTIISHAWVVSSTPPATGGYPLMFVTSVPGTGFMHQLNTFASHGTSVRDTAPGGDLYIRYPDGTLRNLTQEAGYGIGSGLLQSDLAIAAREPTVHWSGEKAIFSMAIGGTPSRYNQTPGRRWQMYEVTGLAKGQPVVITKVAHQPNYNNTSPMYGSQDDIIFTSDAPILGLTHTYPQLDEYESSPTNTGIWKIRAGTSIVTNIQHSPSGSFNLFMDYNGRIIFTRWDHLKRDQQADLDRAGAQYGSYDFRSEEPTAVRFNSPQQDAQGRHIADSRGTLYDLFPEARATVDLSRRANENFHDFNKFTPWMLNEDGSEEETVNHAGRDEFFKDYRNRMFNDDNNLTDVMTNFSANRMVFGGDGGFFQFKEDINRPGYFLGVFSLEFARQASGRIIEIKMDPSVNPEDMVIKDYTNDTLDQDPTGSQPRRATMTGHYRNPLRLSDGDILVSHTPEYRINADEGSGTTRRPRYVFQLKKMIPNPAAGATDNIAGASLTGGIVKDVRWWQDEATQHIYNGPLNETDVVEVRARPRPIKTTKMHIADVERTVIQEQGVNEADFQNWLKRNNLAVMISRNVTIRDRADVTQPFNLRIPGGVQNIPKTGKVYDISAMQIFQADLTRAYNVTPGRRVYAKPIHNSPTHKNVETFYSQPGMTALGADGSMAAIVPAGRALTWQLVAPDNTPVVRERYWITFAPGEIRTCASCHGLNKFSHNNLVEPTNKPEAFRNLLNNWKASWWTIEPQ